MTCPASLPAAKVAPSGAAAAHPGGGVMGAAGMNAAREMLRDG